MYRARRPTNNCHQIASKCTESHIEFQKFSGGYTPGRPSAGSSAPDLHPGLGKWKGGNPNQTPSSSPSNNGADSNLSNIAPTFLRIYIGKTTIVANIYVNCIFDFFLCNPANVIYV